MNLPDITAVERLDLKADEKLIIHVDRDTTIEQVSDLRTAAPQALGIDSDRIIIARDVRFEIFRDEDER